MSESEHSSSAEIIAAGDKSGFRSADALEQAETDDEVYMEFKVQGSSGTHSARGPVADTSETEQDDGKTLVEYYIEDEGTLLESLTVKLLTDDESAYNSILGSAEVHWMGQSSPEDREIDVTHVEVTKR